MYVEYSMQTKKWFLAIANLGGVLHVCSAMIETVTSKDL